MIGAEDDPAFSTILPARSDICSRSGRGQPSVLVHKAAWQLFSEDEIGSLEPGKLVEMVILDGDPRSVTPDAIKNIKVLETWMS